MKRLDETKPTQNDGLNQAGVLAEIRQLKKEINTIIEYVQKNNISVVMPDPVIKKRMGRPPLNRIV